MENVKQLNTLKGKKEVLHPLAKPGQRYLKNILTPVSLAGVIVPWSKELGEKGACDYKLVCSSGLEYFIMADSEWRGVLSCYAWEEVKIVGLLNISNMTIIPQKIFPKGPTGEKENVIDLAAWKSREFIKKFIKTVNDLVLVPAALCAVMA